MVAISYLILFFIIINVNLTTKKKLKMIDYKDLRLRPFDKNMNRHIVNLILFFVFYVVLFRFLRLCSQSNYIDLVILRDKINNNIQCYSFGMCIFSIISYLIILGFIKKIVLFNLKNSFLSLNYFFCYREKNYYKKYVEIIHWHRRLWFWVLGEEKGISFYKKYGIYIYVFFKFIGLFLLICCFVLDLFFNKNILILFSTVLPWVSIYQLFYLINNFFDQKIKFKMDQVVYEYIYCYEISTKKKREEYLSTRDPSFSYNDVLMLNIIDSFGRPEFDELDFKVESLINEYLTFLLK